MLNVYLINPKKNYLFIGLKKKGRSLLTSLPGLTSFLFLRQHIVDALDRFEGLDRSPHERFLESPASRPLSSGDKALEKFEPLVLRDIQI